VTRVNEKAVTGRKALVSVTEIEHGMSSGCNSLARTYLPVGLQTFGQRALGLCAGLNELVVPDGVISRPGSAFDGCAGLTLPAWIALMSREAFDNCRRVKPLMLPSELEVFGDEAFRGVNQVTRLVLLGGTPSKAVRRAFVDAVPSGGHMSAHKSALV
jgi:hypothetical protein